jgi:hypothetical protein
MEKINALHAIHVSPTDMIQRVSTFLADLTGSRNFRMANTIIGMKQIMVLIVQAEKVSSPCRFLSVFLSKCVISTGQPTGILA